LTGRDLLDRWAGALGTVLVLGAWEIGARLGWGDPQTLPSPSQALLVAWHYLTPAEVGADIAVSLGRILAGFVIGSLAAVTLGVLVGWSERTARLIRPLVELLRPIPPLAWIPLAIVWFGLGEGSKVFVIVLGAFFPVFEAAWRGMRGVSPVVLRAARTMDVRGARLLYQVALPAALPDIATGLRNGFGLCFGVLVAAELIAADRGMGHLVMESREIGQLGIAVFGIALIGLVNLLADWQLAWIIRRTVGRWHPL
jgi:ABC-type nitrate/sulfonate/bicarbonate transport system permease component